MNTQANKEKFHELLGKEIGNIKIVEYIGEGSMGVVFKGHHNNLDIDVAVKVIKDELLNTKREEYLGRFEREARIAARLNHRCITRIIDYGEFEGRPYIVIEYVDGFTLSKFVEAHKDNVNEIDVLKLIALIASALQEAHQNNVIHRDIKPQNIMINRKGRPYLTDLGLARNVSDLSMTATSIIIGSPAYMAPENFTGESPVDFKSDIYSLGCVAYFAAFKRSPVKGRTMREIIDTHVEGDIDFVGKTDCRATTLNVIKKMIASDVNKRFATAQEIVVAVKEAIEDVQEQRKMEQIKKREEENDAEYYTETVEAEVTSKFIVSDSFLKIDHVLGLLEQQFGPAVSSHGSMKITHATSKDRMVLWIILISLVVCSIVGYLYTN
jgi:serine/threonine protein kinase